MRASNLTSRLIVLSASLVAAVLACAIATSSAAADWVVAGSPLTGNAALEPVPPMAGPTTFTTTTSPTVKIECAQAGNLEIGESVISPLTEGRYGLFNFLSYGKCAIVSPANCTLTAGALKTAALKWAVSGTTTVVVTLSALSGTTVYEAAVSGTGCGSLTTVKATGQLVAELGGGTSPAVTHSLKFTGVGGSGTLSAASGAATLELRSHKEWNWH